MKMLQIRIGSWLIRNILPHNPSVSPLWRRSTSLYTREALVQCTSDRQIAIYLPMRFLRAVALMAGLMVSSDSMAMAPAARAASAVCFRSMPSR